MDNTPSTRPRVHRNVRRAQGDVVATRIVSAGELRLEPPGMALTVKELFPLP